MKTISFLISLVCFFSLSSQNLSLDDSETYAVVVGISDYQDEGIPDLRFADKDALAFAGFLQSTMGGSLDEDHLKVLLNEEATMGEFAMTLDWLLEVASEQDKVIVYFSGHGEMDKVFDEGFWVPVKAAIGEHDQYIPNSQINTFLNLFLFFFYILLFWSKP